MSDTPVSMEEIEQSFLADKQMCLSAQLSEMLHLEISHSEIDGADSEDCDLFLTVGDNSPEGECLDFFLSAHSICGECYTTCTLDDIVRIFKIDRTKEVWKVS